MIGAVEVLPVPALREEDLVADAVLAGIDVREVEVVAFGIGGIFGSSSAVVCQFIELSGSETDKP